METLVCSSAGSYLGYVWGGVKVFSRGLGLLLLGQGVELVPQDSRKWIIYANHYSGLAFIMLGHQLAL